MEDQANVTTEPVPQAVYPATPAQFFALLEQHAFLGDWTIEVRNVREWWQVTFTPRTFDRKERFVHYQHEKEPLVHLTGVEFNLRDLFVPGRAWDRAVYRANPYMPRDDKHLLALLYLAVTGSTP